MGETVCGPVVLPGVFRGQVLSRVWDSRSWGDQFCRSRSSVSLTVVLSNSMTSIHPEIFGSGRFSNQVHNLEFCREIVVGLCVYGRDAMRATEKWRCNWIGLSPWDLEMLSGSLASRSRRGQWMQSWRQALTQEQWQQLMAIAGDVGSSRCRWQLNRWRWPPANSWFEEEPGKLLIDAARTELRSFVRGL